jgi:glycine cleavage system T protein (aminomethyltransferase)
MDSVKRTPLFALHGRLGARLTEFGGFAMPLSYSGIIEEHNAVRTAAGIFDLSHMGEFEVCGSGALAMLERALTNSAARLIDGQAQYTLMCAEDGGIIDDLIIYRLTPNRYMLCVNASNIAADGEWLRGLLPHDAELHDLSDETALIAVQGPAAGGILAGLSKLSLDSISRFHAARGEVAGIDCMVARTGYTGEDGFEIFLDACDAEKLFEALLNAGGSVGLKPCGLGARDTLRMEAGLPLYGHELDRETSPFEAGLATFVKSGRGFIGEAAMSANGSHPVRKHLVGLRTDDGRSIARQGYKLYRDRREVGVVTSGTFAPTFNRPLAIAYVHSEAFDDAAPQPGAQIDVAIRTRMIPSTIAALPFYRRARISPGIRANP